MPGLLSPSSTATEAMSVLQTSNSFAALDPDIPAPSDPRWSDPEESSSARAVSAPGALIPVTCGVQVGVGKTKNKNGSVLKAWEENNNGKRPAF